MGGFLETTKETLVVDCGRRLGGSSPGLADKETI